MRCVWLVIGIERIQNQHFALQYGRGGITPHLMARKVSPDRYLVVPTISAWVAELAPAPLRSLDN